MKSEFKHIVHEDYKMYKQTPPTIVNIIKLMVESRGFHYTFWLRMLHYRHFVALSVLMHRILSTLYGIQISAKTPIGKGFKIVHAISIVIHKKANIGDYCSIHQNCTIGIEHSKVPKIGNHVMIGANAVILGGVEIGDGVKIGAGAVVLTDVPDDSIAVGVPARVIRNGK